MMSHWLDGRVTWLVESPPTCDFELKSMCKSSSEIPKRSVNGSQVRDLAFQARVVFFGIQAVKC